MSDHLAKQMEEFGGPERLGLDEETCLGADHCWGCPACEGTGFITGPYPNEWGLKDALRVIALTDPNKVADAIEKLPPEWFPPNAVAVLRAGYQPTHAKASHYRGCLVAALKGIARAALERTEKAKPYDWTF